jgi:hypothetical protein
MKLLGVDIDIEYAKGLEEQQFKKEFGKIFGIYLKDAWDYVKKQKPKNDKADKQA